MGTSSTVACAIERLLLATRYDVTPLLVTERPGRVILANCLSSPREAGRG